MFLRLNYNVVLSLIQRRRFFNVLVIRSFYQQYNNVLTISLQRFFIINITELLGRHLNVKWPRFYNVGKCHDTVEQHRDVKATAIQRRSYVVCLLGLTNEKHFLKTMSHQIMIVVCNFSLSSFKLREGIQPALTKFLNKFSKWKTTCYIKRNFSCGIFLFLLAKYLISVAIALTHFKQGCIKPGITTDNFSIVRILNFHSKPDVRMKTMPYTLFVLHLEWQELSKSGNSTLMLFLSRTALSFR